MTRSGITRFQSSRLHKIQASNFRFTQALAQRITTPGTTTTTTHIQQSHQYWAQMAKANTSTPVGTEQVTPAALSLRIP